MMENNEGLVKRLKFLRKEKGVTQKQLADRTPAYKWEEPEIVLAVGDNLSTLFDTVERAVREVSDEEQKLVFDVLV